jgi:hypothetical protein
VIGEQAEQAQPLGLAGKLDVQEQDVDGRRAVVLPLEERHGRRSPRGPAQADVLRRSRATRDDRRWSSTTDDDALVGGCGFGSWVALRGSLPEFPP